MSIFRMIDEKAKAREDRFSVDKIRSFVESLDIPYYIRIRASERNREICKTMIDLLEKGLTRGNALFDRELKIPLDEEIRNKFRDFFKLVGRDDYTQLVKAFSTLGYRFDLDEVYFITTLYCPYIRKTEKTGENGCSRMVKYSLTEHGEILLSRIRELLKDNSILVDSLRVGNVISGEYNDVSALDDWIESGLLHGEKVHMSLRAEEKLIQYAKKKGILKK